MGNLHLCAREHLAHRREKEFKKIMSDIWNLGNYENDEEIKNCIGEALTRKNILCVGDFNMHLRSETGLIY